MKNKSNQKIWPKVPFAILLGAALTAIPLSAVFAESPNVAGAHVSNTKVSHRKSGSKTDNLPAYLNIAKLASLKNYTFTSVTVDKGKLTKTYGSVYSMSNFSLNGSANIIYAKGQGYEKFKNSFKKISISSPLAYIEKVDEYTWAKQLISNIHSGTTRVGRVATIGSCKIANNSGTKYEVYSSKLSKPLSLVCISAKTGALLWYQSDSGNVKNKNSAEPNFTVTSIGKVKPITVRIPKSASVKKPKGTTNSVPVILHSIPASFPASILKPPGNLSDAYVQGNPNSIWIILTSPQSATDVTRYISSLKSAGFKLYGKQYTNYTTTLRNSSYYVTVSYETLGPSVVEMTTSIKKY